jgi:glycosyltransferase involved in cell wall biosynthesis
MPLKILQVCSAESFGGGERHVADLARALLERGHEVHLAVRPNSPLREALNPARVHWHELGLRNALDVMSAWQLAETIRQERIDVLHAHLARDYTFCGIAARMARRKGTPVRFFLTRHHFHPIKANPVYAWTIGEARKLIAVSESVRATLSEAFPAYADRVVVIPNWVELRRVGNLNRELARARLGVKRNLAVGLIGQLTPLKRQDMFIRVAAGLIRERNWQDVEFLLVGAPGKRAEDAEYAKQLEALAQESGLGEQLRFTGFVRDLALSMAAFDVVVAPSDNEAFSLALIEAMAAGCAVIATRVGGMAEIVEDEATGLLIEPGDDWSLANALSRLLVNRQMRAKLGEAARACVRERYDRAQVIAQIEQLYQAD